MQILIIQIEMNNKKELMLQIFQLLNLLIGMEEKVYFMIQGKMCSPFKMIFCPLMMIILQILKNRDK